MSRSKRKAWVVYEIGSDGKEVRVGFYHGGTDSITLGRSAASDLIIGRYDLGISRRQLLLSGDDGGLQVENLGRSEVYREKDGEAFHKSKKIRIKEGEALRISETRLQFRRESVGDAFFAEFALDGKIVRRVAIPRGEITVGSGKRPLNTVRIKVEGVSRQHLSIRPLANHRFLLCDLDSKNGLFVQVKGADIAEKVDEVEIGIGDTFSFGPVVGVIHQGALPGKGRSRALIISGAVLFLLLLFALMRSGQEVVEEEPFCPMAFSQIMAGYGGMEDKNFLPRIRAVVDSIGDRQDSKRKHLETYLALLEEQRVLSAGMARLNRQRSGKVDLLLNNPWGASNYIFPVGTDRADLDRAAENLAAVDGSISTVAAGLGVSHSLLAAPVEVALVGQWQRMKIELEALQSALEGCKRLLQTWESRSWINGPTPAEKEDWWKSANRISTEFREKTSAVLDSFEDKWRGAESFWKSVDQWIIQEAEGGASGLIKFPAVPSWWQGEVVDEKPFNYIAEYAVIGNGLKLPENYARLASGHSFARLEGLHELSQLIPGDWRESDKAVESARLKKIQELNTLLDELLQLTGPLHGHADVGDNLLRAMHSSIVGSISRFPSDWPNLSSSFIGSQELISKIEETKDGILKLCELIHSLSPKWGEAVSAKDVKDVISHPVLNIETPSRFGATRKIGLEVWISEVLE